MRQPSEASLSKAAYGGAAHLFAVRQMRALRAFALRGGAVLLSLWVILGASPALSKVAVGLVQLRSEDVGNFEVMKVLATQAKAQGAVLVIYPEASDLGWLNPAAFTKAEPIPGKYSDAFASIALELGIWVAAGLTEKGPKAGPGSQPEAHQAYDAGILINPKGEIVIRHRQFNVVRNAFDPAACQAILNMPQCSYLPGEKQDIKVVRTPFGRTAILVCADAYTYAPAEALERLKTQSPDFVIVPWGITAGAAEQCGMKDFNATGYAAEAAAYLKSAFVVGANAVGNRPYGRFLPSLYCGDSGYATPTGQPFEASQETSTVVMVQIPESFRAPGGTITSDEAATRLCPQVCDSYAAAWTNEWTGASPGSEAMCGCRADTGQ